MAVHVKKQSWNPMRSFFLFYQFTIHFNADEKSYYYYYYCNIPKIFCWLVILYIYRVLRKHIIYNIIIIIIIRRSCYDCVLGLQRSAEPRHDCIMFLVLIIIYTMRLIILLLQRRQSDLIIIVLLIVFEHFTYYVCHRGEFMTVVKILIIYVYTRYRSIYMQVLQQVPEHVFVSGFFFQKQFP